jgi:hypothetical protein
MADVLLIFGLILLVAAAFLASVIFGLAVAGGSCVLLSVAFSDGKGISWRRS